MRGSADSLAQDAGFANARAFSQVSPRAVIGIERSYTTSAWGVEGSVRTKRERGRSHRKDGRECRSSTADCKVCKSFKSIGLIPWLIEHPHEPVWSGLKRTSCPFDSLPSSSFHPSVDAGHAQKSDRVPRFALNSCIA